MQLIEPNNTETGTPSSQRIRDRLAGHQILITGGTGFLAKAFVEKLLRSVDTIGGIHLLVRPRPGGLSPAKRVQRDVLQSRVYDRLRATLGDRFAELCKQKIHVVGGDLTKERLGLAPDAYKRLAQRITLVVNSAATVTFDERIDWAVELNSLGPTRLLRFARECGNVPFLHVSTCYVCGARQGEIVEDFSAPEAARETLPRIAETGKFDLDALVGSLREKAAKIRDDLGADTEGCRQRLIEAGMASAHQYGWHDTYSFTKWIGEQLLVRDHGDVPVTIFRPAIIESSMEEPTPGWIDGLRMADPIIVAYGRGKLTEFPARAHIALDLIPVDFVANAMVATLPVGEMQHSGITTYQCASSARHPLHLSQLISALQQAFLTRPMTGDDGRPIYPGPLRVADRTKFLKRWESRRRLLARWRRLLEGLGIARKHVRKIASLSRKIEQLIYFVKIYSPYTHLDCRFADDGLCRVVKSMHPDDRREFPFDVADIDWHDYIVNRHVPGIRSFVLGTGSEPSRILAKERFDEDNRDAGSDALKGNNLFDVFRRCAERFPDKPALQIRRENRWTRYTYDEALRATGSIMHRFLEYGLFRGDCVAICGENGPEWGLTYLAAMRAGLTAVPLDPTLPPPELWAAARFVDVKLLCAGATTAEGLIRARSGSDAEVVVMAQPFVPPPAASRDHAPDPVPVDGNAIASILFTSGTTVAPKVVPLTHRNLIANAQALFQIHPVRPSDELLSVLPMYHVFEFTGGFLIPLASAATITYVERLKGAEIRAAMQATGTTIMLVVPRLLRMFHDAIMDQVAKAGLIRRALFRSLCFLSDLTGRRLARRMFRTVHRRFGGRLRMFVSGGSRLGPELHDVFERMGFLVCEGYGLTETSPVLTVNPPGSSRAGSVGPALPNIEIDIRNTNVEGIGEVWVKGPSVMSGYLNDPEATREVLVDGWYCTDDLGRLEEDGYLVLTGRSKDLIISGAGKNVYPDEVEERYRDLPYVEELCVFGMPSDDGFGDTIHAVIVPDRETNPELDPSSLEREVRLAVESIAEFLPPHQRIAVLHFWNSELPKTSTLKAKRSLIRDMVLADEKRDDDAPRADIADGSNGFASVAARSKVGTSPESLAVVHEVVARHANRPGVDSVHEQMHLLLDLGIDSIGKLDLLSDVETRFGISINDDNAGKITRVADLLHEIGDRKPVSGAGAAQSRWKSRLAATGDKRAVDGHVPAPLLPLRWLMRGGANVFMNTYVRVHAIGREHIPEEGPFILAPNHASHLDAPALLNAVGTKRRVWVAGAEDYFFNTKIKRFVFGKLFDTIAVNRQDDGFRGLQRCGRALTRGDGLLMFPEGTRSVTGRMERFKIGIAVLAVERNVPIVPVHIDRTYDLLRKGQRFIRPGAVTVRFGQPIAPPALSQRDRHYEAYQALTREVESAVMTLGRESTA